MGKVFSALIPKNHEFSLDCLCAIHYIYIHEHKEMVQIQKGPYIEDNKTSII